MKLVASFPALLAFGLCAGNALAIDCSTLEHPVYATGSSAFESILAQLATVVAGGSSPIHIIYQPQGSCAGVDAVLNGTPIMGSGATGATYWDATGEQMCDLPMTGTVADLGISDVFPTTCFDLPNGLPSNVGDFSGPVQAMTFIVPKTSTQTSISADAAYFVFGFGANSGVKPWEAPNVIFVRDGTSGTEQMISAAIGVPSAKWLGTSETGSSEMITAVSASKNAQATIGILDAADADASRDKLSVLAYEHTDQTCGYYPDSAAQSFDKRNVRDGHYAIWGPVHILSELNAQGYPINADAKSVVGYITGTLEPPMGLDIIALEAQSHVVPQCAMHVKRTEELGPLASFAPENACGCYFEKSATGKTSCAACTSVGTCPSGTSACNFGYCED